MKILCNDIGTGTQDILLFDSRLDVENSYKLILPSPTMMVHRRLQQLAARQASVCLTGVTMGGGPSSWAVEAVLKAGGKVYATPAAAATINDDLAAVRELGIHLIDEAEVKRLPADVERVEFRDFDFPAIVDAFARFGVSLSDLDAVAVAAFDHGAAPPEVSDRQFRFDYLAERIARNDKLSTFAFLAQDTPAIMTRLLAVRECAYELTCPLIIMDSAPAAVLGATLAQPVADGVARIVANIGNFHTLAFRLSGERIDGLFEHHTGLLNRLKLEEYLGQLGDGSLSHASVFHDHGHGAWLRPGLTEKMEEQGVIVTGPRRKMMTGSHLNPVFPAPFGDMMTAGCFGLLAAVADLLPEYRTEIRVALAGDSNHSTTPWEL
jgi:uncharacterized protein (DUF1786 family)